MYPKLTLLIALLLPAVCAQAQGQTAPDKKPLVARILKAQQPGIEAAGRALAERPALAMLDQAGAALQARVAPEKRDAIGKEIQADVKKYLDEAVPLVRDRAIKIAPTSIGPLLEEKFTEEELKQIAAILESPAYNKYQQMGVDMQNVLLEKLVAETRGAIEPKVKALELAVGKRLGVVAPPPAKAASGK